jgi:hypothetical protein
VQPVPVPAQRQEKQRSRLRSRAASSEEARRDDVSRGLLFARSGTRRRLPMCFTAPACSSALLAHLLVLRLLALRLLALRLLVLRLLALRLLVLRLLALRLLVLRLLILRLLRPSGRGSSRPAPCNTIECNSRRERQRRRAQIPSRFPGAAPDHYKVPFNLEEGF